MVKDKIKVITEHPVFFYSWTFVSSAMVSRPSCYFMRPSWSVPYCLLLLSLSCSPVLCDRGFSGRLTLTVSVPVPSCYRFSLLYAGSLWPGLRGW